MSRIGDFADDDIAGFAVKSPELGAAMATFSQAVYTKGRLPIRVREAARIVIAHANECVVCQNTRDSKGEAGGVDEDLYDHA
ncbi:MAG: carboxymuconolactone decarboxylase family protein, partial [Pirellulales bacterium]